MKKTFLKQFWLHEGETVDAGQSTQIGDQGGAQGAFATVSMSSPEGQIETLKSTTFTDFVPDAYKETAWTQNILKSDKPNEEMFKQFANLQELVGKKSMGIPDETTSAEDREKFYESLGRPKTAEEYQFSDGTWSSEEKEILEKIKTTKDEEFLKGVKDIFHKNGIPQKAADAIQQEYTKLLLAKTGEALKNINVQEELSDKDFDELSQKRFGAERVSVMNTGKNIIANFGKPDDKETWGSFSNRQLMVVSDLLDTLNKQYIHEDKFRDAEGVIKSITSEADIRTKAIEIQQSKAYTNAWDPGHEAAKKQVKALYAGLR